MLQLCPSPPWSSAGPPAPRVQAFEKSETFTRLRGVTDSKRWASLVWLGGPRSLGSACTDAIRTRRTLVMCPPGSGTPAQGLGHLSVLRHTRLVTVTRFLTMAPEGRAGLSACLKAVVSRAVWGPCPEGDPVMITVFLETGHATELTFPGSPEQSPGLGPPSCLEGPAPPQSWARSAHSRRSALHPGQVRRFGGEGPPRVARPAPPPDDEASNSDTLCCAFNCTSLCFSQGPFVVPQVGKLSYRP